MQRVITYIDGFNLYFGLRASHYRRYYWLSVRTLALNLLRPEQQLLATKYFTARLAGPPEKQRNQSLYLEALQVAGGVDLLYGRYQHNTRTCRACGYAEQVPSEKMTDVNIAVELLADAFRDQFDTALLLSADSDLVAPLEMVRRLFPTKRIVVAFPPGRHSVALRNAASAYLTIGRATLARSLLPAELHKPDGYLLRCPEGWR